MKTKKQPRPKLTRELDPGVKEMRRAQRQARESGSTIHRRGHQLYREPKP